MSAWALDLGTTNTTLARWDALREVPEMIHLPDVCREAGPDQKIEVRFAVPSSVFLLPPRTWQDVVGAWAPVQQRIFWGRQALIGRAALERDGGWRREPFVPAFKPALLQSSFRPLTHLKGRPMSAREVAAVFLRELLAEVTRVTGERPRDLTVGTPVDSFEPYRAVLRDLLTDLGVKRVRTVDEPVAAALGYGLRPDRGARVLVLDFGGGTLDGAVLRLEEGNVASGHAAVLAKDAVPVGGRLVDAWMVEEVCRRGGYDLHPEAAEPAAVWWHRIMMEECCRVKEALYLRDHQTLLLTPPRDRIALGSLTPEAVRARAEPVEFCRADLTGMLESRGLYQAIDGLVDRLLAAARVPEGEMAEVLMVGGSTLLPDVYPRIVARFGRDRVRAWQPFDAVAYGAAAFAAERFARVDFITHDYALVTHDAVTHTRQHHVVVRAGTPFPTAPDHWKRVLTPTCVRGEPERVFKLEIAEIGRSHGPYQEMVWDEGGALHALSGDPSEAPVVVPLNATNPTLGILSPPHPPGDTTPRLEVSLGVNADRWLVANVLDLKTGKTLMDGRPVVRLQ